MNNLTRALAALTLWCACAMAADAVLISDTLKVPQETGLFYGTITVSAPEMRWGGVTYKRWEKDYRVEAGVVAITLVPNTTATPAETRYRITYKPDSNARPWTRQWNVPESATALKVEDVEEADVTAPAAVPLLNVRQINPTGATTGFCIQYNGTTVTWGSCGGGAGAWGGITGTLADQTDLQIAFNAKAAISHAHIVGDVTGLQTALNAKADASAMTTALSAKADASATTTALSGKEPTITEGSSGQFLGWDKTWRTPTGEVATAGAGLVKVATEFSIDDTQYLGYSVDSGEPTGVGAVGEMYIRTSNHSLYLGTGTGWSLVTATASVTPSSTLGDIYMTNDAGAAAWGGISVSSGLTKAFAGSTITLALDAAIVPTKAGDNVWTGKRIVTPTAEQVLVAGTAVVAAQVAEVSAAADVTLTATPTIADGTAGEFMTLMNVGTTAITFQDETVLTGSNLYLASNANYELKAKNAMQLVFSATAGGWMQVGGGGTTVVNSGVTWGNATGTWGTVTGTFGSGPA